MAGYRHVPAFAHLCDLADVRGLQVRLPAGIVRSGLRKGEEYRQLTRIELWESHLPGISGVQRYGGKPVASAPIYNDDLEAAAHDLLARAA
jgi:hypothetical protein